MFQVLFVVWGAADAPKGGTGSRIFSPFPPAADTAPPTCTEIIFANMHRWKQKNLKQLCSRFLSWCGAPPMRQKAAQALGFSVLFRLRRIPHRLPVQTYSFATCTAENKKT